MYGQLMQVGVGALSGATQAALEKYQDKVKLERKEPPPRKLGNVLLSLEAVRRLSGRKSFADLLEEDRARSEGLRLQGIEEEGLRRQYGTLGTESPGMMERMLNAREAVTPALLGAFNQAQVARRESAIPMLQDLMAQNPPYVKQKVKKGKTWAKILSGGAAGAMGGLTGTGNAEPTKPAPTGATQGLPATSVAPPSTQPVGAGMGGGISTIGGTGVVNVPGTTGIRQMPRPSLSGNKELMDMLASRYGAMGGGMAGGMR